MAFRHGQSQSYYSSNTPRFNPNESTPQGGSHRPALPDWLKTPETKAREAEALRHTQQPVPAGAAPVVKRPSLTVIQGGQTQAPVAPHAKTAPQAKSASASTKPKRKVARSTAAKTAPTKSVAKKKRVPAPARRKES